MLTGTPSTKVAKSVPWSRLKPRRKYWLALPSPLCWVTTSPGTASSTSAGRSSGRLSSSSFVAVPSLAALPLAPTCRAAVTITSSRKPDSACAATAWSTAAMANPAASIAAVPLMVTATSGAPGWMQQRDVRGVPRTNSGCALHPVGALPRRATWTFYRVRTTTQGDTYHDSPESVFIGVHRGCGAPRDARLQPPRSTLHRGPAEGRWHGFLHVPQLRAGTRAVRDFHCQLQPAAGRLWRAQLLHPRPGGAVRDPRRQRWRCQPGSHLPVPFHQYVEGPDRECRRPQRRRTADQHWSGGCRRRQSQCHPELHHRARAWRSALRRARGSR